MLNLEDLKKAHSEKKSLIAGRLSDFSNFSNSHNDRKIFEELVFCILAANTSAKMGITTVREIRDILFTADVKKLSGRLKGIYRFYNVRADYIVHTRNFLMKEYDLRLMDHLLSFSNPLERRDFLAMTRDIKGIGFKEASHFLRNVGFRGYSILDKHVIKCLYELGVIHSVKSPSTRKQYLETEQALKEFSRENDFDPDELDLLLWSEKTGEILK